MLKILHFSTADNEGGSGRSAYRIHTGLRSLGHKSNMLVGKKVTTDPDVSLIAGSTFGRLVDLAADRLTRLIGHQYLHVPSSSKVLKNPMVKSADVIQIFNTHGGYFSHKLLPELSKIAPIVWRLSDMWPMTPHAAYGYDCECYKKGPEHCICKLSSYPAIYRNTKKMLWEIKEEIYKKSDITIVAPSSWTEKLARESLLLSRFKIHKIPNGINLDIFHPRDKVAARKKLNIDPKAKVILFTAHGLDNNPRKGSEALIEALNKLKNKEGAMLLLAGNGGQSFVGRVPLSMKFLGYLEDQNILADIYSAADVMVVPSVVENLPNNLLEAMACGTPAVAFDAGGMNDAVKHLETGYLAEYGDTKDLAHGISQLLNDVDLIKKLSANAHDLMKAEFDQKLEAKRFEKLYIELVEGRKK